MGARQGCAFSFDGSPAGGQGMLTPLLGKAGPDHDIALWILVGLFWVCWQAGCTPIAADCAGWAELA